MTNIISNDISIISTNILQIESEEEVIKIKPTIIDEEKLEIQEKSKMTHEEKLEIQKNISNLKEHELMRIYYILEGNDEKYTTNNNGVWFNFNKLKISTQDKINNYIKMCIRNSNKYNI